MNEKPQIGFQCDTNYLLYLEILQGAVWKWLVGGLGEAQNLVRKVPSSLVEERKDAYLSNLPPAIIPLGCDIETTRGEF